MSERKALVSCEMWNYLRLFPLMMGQYIQKHDPVWSLLGQLISIVERVCSLSFKEIDLVHLEYFINNFFNDYCSIFPDVALKPKSHFIFHYPEMIRKFGPLVKTLRFEAKNGFCKNVVSNSKNYMNVCKSIATHRQMYMYLSYKQDDYLEKPVTAICSSEVAIASESIVVQEMLRNVLPDDVIHISKSRCVVFEGERYNKDSVVILDFINDEYLFGRIECAYFLGDGPYLLCSKLWTIHFDNHHHAYVVCLITILLAYTIFLSYL